MATSDNSTVKASTPSEVAELFNQYFASISSIAQGIPAPERENDQPQNSNPFLTDVSLPVSQVELILRNLNTSKATDPDIPAKILKETADAIAPLLTELFNKSLRLGYLPEDWNWLANIVPVFKMDNKEQAENYGPISLLSIVSKVMERYIFNSIRDHVFHLFSACQHGFLAERSCVTQLVEVLDQIGAKLDRGGQIDIIYLGMSKAFDKVNQAKLLRKLRQYGFEGNLLSYAWLESYRHNRSQRVTTLGATSSPLPVSSGVPQGSIQGPMLFLLYVNSLPDAVRSSQIATFADDTKVFKRDHIKAR